MSAMDIDKPLDEVGIQPSNSYSRSSRLSLALNAVVVAPEVRLLDVLPPRLLLHLLDPRRSQSFRSH
jgi:hypothetical protein